MLCAGCRACLGSRALKGGHPPEPPMGCKARLGAAPWGAKPPRGAPCCPWGCDTPGLAACGSPGRSARRDPQIFQACLCHPASSPKLAGHPDIARGVFSAGSFQGSQPILCILLFYFPRSPSAVSPFSKSLVRDRGRSTEITQPQTALRKELPELQHSLPSSLLPKVCVCLGSSAVFSLVVWGFLLAAFFQAASPLAAVASALTSAVGRHRAL